MHTVTLPDGAHMAHDAWPNGHRAVLAGAPFHVMSARAAESVRLTLEFLDGAGAR